MDVPYRWLQSYFDQPLPKPEDLADLLTTIGPEVEGVTETGVPIAGLVVGQLLEVRQHPNADKLTVCSVDTGSEPLSIVCGATNHQVGDKVVVATVGTELPDGLKIKKSKLRGEVSQGMLCSTEELGLPGDASGILILDKKAPKPGTPADFLFESDAILDLALTANRGDLLCMNGVAREVAAGSGLQATFHVTSVTENQTTAPDITIDDTDGCRRYASRIIQGVRIGPSPDWLVKRLQQIDVAIINNVVDASNYVLHEMGQPLHVFDLAKLKGPKIIVRRATQGESLPMLDGKTRELDPDRLVIADAKRPVALAGVMGGSNSEVDEATTDLLLESAWFRPSLIRRSARKFGLKTTSSYRYERRADPESVLPALDRLTELILAHAGGEAGPVTDVYPEPFEERHIRFDHDLIEDKLGYEIPSRRVLAILESIGCSVEFEHGDYVVAVPQAKSDVERPIDLIEELARLNGFDHIPIEIPATRSNPDLLAEPEDLAPRIREILVGLGITETVSYSFVSREDTEKLGLLDHFGEPIEVMNPQSKEEEYLRTSLIPDMMRTLQTNINRGSQDLAFFEIGRVFRGKAENPFEHRSLGILIVGHREPFGPHQEPMLADYYDLKGYAETLLSGFEVTFMRSSFPFLHPGRQEEFLDCEGHYLGYLGELHPASQKAVNLRDPAYLLEMNLDQLMTVGHRLVSYQPFARSPVVRESLALLADEQVAHRDLKHAMANASPLVREIVLKEVYRGDQVPEGKKSLTYEILYQHQEKTLTDNDVAKVRGRLLKAVEKSHQARLRDT